METPKTPDDIIESLFTQQNNEEISPVENSENMTKHVVDPDDFALYKKYLDIKQEYIHNTDICMLSMGMTHDFEIALQEGANIIRVGTGIFH